ncbi:LOW QUALITY PROTEIN: hypothetical protein TorRG33x02_159460 [Trema orientale]|uniref:Uncharacterized protein n=1 Tax=Trema orientale TaxID=63057 RepID=A0A2P5ES30_TREOI|nr:LOW QUALITY PROTEIN: hypothetical protein TorRG33x02_159460 [Trema orientale]
MPKGHNSSERNIPNQSKTSKIQEAFLTKELIGVKVSWPLAISHGRPADWESKKITSTALTISN